MKIQVLFFSLLREAAGEPERTISLEEGSTLKEALDLLFAEPKLRRYSALPMRYAVNESFADVTVRLRDRDRVALIPPVAGGCV